MQSLSKIAFAFVIGLVLAPTPGISAEDSHMKHDGQAGEVEVEVKGVVNSVDAEKKSVNVTHEPVEALGWPQMTMDLPVTRRVDLSKVEAGSTVKFMLKQGHDKQFRITEIEKAE